MPRSPSAFVLVVGVGWVVANACGVARSVDASMFVGLAAVAVISIVTGIRWYKPTPQWPWWAIGGALTLFLVGGASRQQFNTLGDLTSHRSLLPDVVTIPGYVLLGLAVGGLAWSRRRGRPGDLDAALDGVIAALGTMAVSWAFLVSPVIDKGNRTLSVEVVLAVYPALSAFLFALSARLAFSAASQRVTAYWLLFASMGMLLLGDVVYMATETGRLHLPLVITDVPYALAYVCCAACVLHPSMRRITEPIPPDQVAPKNGRLVFVTAALGVPAVVTVAWHSSTAGDQLVLTTIIVALSLVVSWRVLRALRAHARSEADLAYQATHDPLTKLPNRLAAESYLEHMGNDVVARGKRVALLFLDLDRFKMLNDTMGHSAGDELLIAVAARLTLCVPDNALVARVGGDEFLIMLPDVTELGDVLDLCERIRMAMEAPFPVRGTDTYTSASIGATVTTGRELAVSAEAMIREADTAMYQAKDAGRNGVSLFDAPMRDRVTERLTIERDLHLALERDELSVHFQPIIRLPAGPVEGVEALLRWSHPTRGAIAPAIFIPIAEESTLINDIGNWVLEHACRHLSELRRDVELAADLYVSVNLSARQLRDPHVVRTVRDVLARTGLPSSALSLELTESLLVEERSAIDVLDALRGLGVRLVIDDFGTGYSSLSYLQRFPAQAVKIDQSFVKALNGADTSQESLVAAIIAMASALGMTVVAEGVETPMQEARLIQMGCHAAQGFFYSRPVPASGLASALRLLAEDASTLARGAS